MTHAYVEYLRARRALLIVAIVLGVILVLAVLARLSWGNFGIDRDRYYADMEHSPTAHVTRTVLPNGHTRAIVDDPKRNIHVVIERDHNTITIVTISEPRSAQHGAQRRETMRGGVRNGDTRVETGDMAFSTMSFGLAALFSLTVPLGLLAATLLAGPLAKENDGHLELAWTKPVSRERYALSAVLVDVAAVVAAEIMSAAALLAGTALWQIPKLSFERGAAMQVAFALLVPIAWYACLTALSASLKRGLGAVLGIGWVAAFAVPTIAAQTEHSDTAVGRSVHAIFGTVSYLDPIAYAWFNITARVADQDRATLIGVLGLAGLAVAYVALAVAQWLRAEA